MSTENERQYGTEKNLLSRANLQIKYTTRDWFAWTHRKIGITHGARILDMGCGPGWFWRSTEATLTDIGQLTLVDLSPTMLTQAIENVGSLNHILNLDAVEADAINLPLNDNAFDTALALHVLYHVSDQEAAISELARVVGQSGQVVVSTNSLDNMQVLMKIAQDSFGGPGKDPGALLFTPDRAIELLSKHFSRVEPHLFKDRYTITDADDIFAALISMPPGTDANDKERRKLKDILSQMEISQEKPLHDTRETFLLIASNN